MWYYSMSTMTQLEQKHVNNFAIIQDIDLGSAPLESAPNAAFDKII